MKKGEAAKEVIITQSLTIFLKYGYSNTSLAAICSETGFTKGGIYYHFPGGKEELYKACLDEFFSCKTPPQWMTEEGLSVRERLEKGFNDIERSKEWICRKVGVDSDDAILRFYEFLYEATRKYPEFQDMLDISDDLKHKALEEVFIKSKESGEISSDIDPEILAVELDLLLQQALYMSFVNKRMKNDKSIIKRMMEGYCKRLV